jgi:DNA-directed RNA polymerase specialized sigma24 family protein
MKQADLAQLSTHWSNIFRAREAEGDAALAARNALLLRYVEVVMRYLRAVLRDPEAVDQVCSNFATRVLESDRLFQNADPQRGRFRDYLKAVLQHMIADYYRERSREHKQFQHLTGEHELADPTSSTEKHDEDFVRCWREELIKWVWHQLEQRDRKTGQKYAVLLRLQAKKPKARSAQLAEMLSAKLGRPFTAAGVRQMLHRGRELFGELLVAEVARSLQVDPGDPDGNTRVEQELIDLGLLFSYCKKALQRCRVSAQQSAVSKEKADC